MKFFWFDLIVYLFCRPLTKWRRESNPGRLGGKRERFLCAMLSPLEPIINLFFVVPACH